jgi:electron transport complex protein RnfA
MIGELAIIFLGAVLVNNFVLSRFLGLCPYLGVSREIKSAMGMGMAVIFVMTIASAATWGIYNYLLIPGEANLWFQILGKSWDLTFLRTLSFILVIAALVQLVEMVVLKTSPPLYRALGIYLPLITTNCAILGVAVLNVDTFFGRAGPVDGSFIKSLVNGFSAGVGFTLALVIMAAIRERQEMSDAPEAFRGAPIAFLTAALLSMAFLGFSGMM